MNQNIEYIIEKERFRLQRHDYIVLGAMFFVALAVTIGIAIKSPDLNIKLGVVVALIFLSAIVLRSYKSSQAFKRIATGFSEEQNQKLVVLTLQQMKLRIFQDQEYPVLYVCIIPLKGTSDQEEIYLIAKEGYILINTKKDNPMSSGGSDIDFVERIGGQIFNTAMRIRKKSGLL